jgi:beta-glucanase (GH16 family)
VLYVYNINIEGGKISMNPLNASDYSKSFHLYTALWVPGRITFLVDGKQYFTVTKNQIPKMWVFNNPQFIILNLAVGGDWPGNPLPNTTFPNDYIIDYVKVWQ